MRTELCGILPAVASPCDENDRFLEDVFAEHLASLYRARIRGVYVCGSTGDGKRMRLDDRKRAAQIAVEVSKEFGGKVLLHVGAETTRDAVELSEHGAEAGVDIVSSLVPNNCSHSDILSYYTDIAKASSLPILAYHIPILSSRVATFEEVLSVLDIEHVMGIKISQWDLFFLQRVRWARPDLVIFSGYDEFLCPGLLYGADGGIGMPRQANIVENGRHQVIVAKQVGCDPSGSNMAGPRHQCRHFDRSVKHIWRIRAIPLAPDPMVTHVHAIVRTEYDQGVITQVVPLKPSDQTSDIRIHGGNGRKVTA